MLIFGVSLVLLFGITAAMVIFVVRYHRSRAPQPTSQASGNIWLEIVWTALPTVIVLAMFYYGWAGYLALRNVPSGAMPVTAVAQMWSWSFEYENGKTSSRLYVPVGKPVKVELVSRDVLHGFYIPAFRVKRDVVPGMKNDVWFVAEKAGSYDIFCSLYCGAGHSAMITTVEAVSPEEFSAWLQQGTAEHPGKALLEKYGCIGCHSLDGSRKIGPTFRGIWGRHLVVTTNGKERSLVADEPYLRRSTLEPAADLVKGFPPVMPHFAGRISDQEMAKIIDFFRSATAPAKLDGKTIAKEKGCLVCHSLDGSRGVGPSFKGLFGHRVIVLRGGKPFTLIADEAYLKESISAPAAAVVEGFPPVMPPNPGLTEEELKALVEFIKEQR